MSHAVEPRKNNNIPLTCKNCVILDIWTCRLGATGECADLYKGVKSDCPARVDDREELVELIEKLVIAHDFSVSTHVIFPDDVYKKVKALLEKEGKIKENGT